MYFPRIKGLLAPASTCFLLLYKSTTHWFKIILERHKNLQLIWNDKTLIEIGANNLIYNILEKELEVGVNLEIDSGTLILSRCQGVPEIAFSPRPGSLVKMNIIISLKIIKNGWIGGCKPTPGFEINNRTGKAWPNSQLMSTIRAVASKIVTKPEAELETKES